MNLLVPQPLSSLKNLPLPIILSAFNFIHPITSFFHKYLCTNIFNLSSIYLILQLCSFQNVVQGDLRVYLKPFKVRKAVHLPTTYVHETRFSWHTSIPTASLNPISLHSFVHTSQDLIIPLDSKKPSCRSLKNGPERFPAVLSNPFYICPRLQRAHNMLPVND